jgi:ribonuclease P protein component
LRRKAEFERLLREGSRRSAAGYTFYTVRREAGRARLGMLVSRRHARRAVERNRIKRCIREAFRLEQEKLGALDLLVRPPYGVKPSADMITQLRALLARLNA